MSSGKSFGTTQNEGKKEGIDFCFFWDLPIIHIGQGHLALKF